MRIASLCSFVSIDSARKVMKFRRDGLAAAVLALFNLMSFSANASSVLNIPFSAGVTVAQLGEACTMIPGHFYGSEVGTPCNIDFPIEVPVGHSIQQITVIHSTNTADSNPFIFAKLAITEFYPFHVEPYFIWTSTDLVPDGAVDFHNLMTQTTTKAGTLYPDQFQVLPNTMYHLHVLIQDLAAIEGLQITYQ